MLVTARVEENNGDGENLGGFVILADDQEVTRVAFDRTQSANPDVRFEDQVDIEVGKAQYAVEKIRELFAAAGQLQ